MITWFQAKVPIRTKFDLMITTFTALAAVPVATTWLLAGSEELGILLVAVAALIVTLVIGIAVKKLICDPYVGTVLRMEGLASGDFDTPIAYTDFTDCVGRMTKAMDVFRRNGITISEADRAQRHVVGVLGAGLSKLADNDLTHRIDAPFSTDCERLRVDFNRAMDAVAEVITAVREAADGINNGADDIRQASDDLSQRTEQQAASLEETAAAMDEVTGTVRGTAAGAARANAVVCDARREAETSGEVVLRAVAAMNSIERGSLEISEIISVIDGIAFQTNLLALNAGVEAARAGDAGKGFAVVASEVRALAQRSADAAKDVKDKITTSSKQVKTGVELVNQTGGALQRIIDRISEISTLVAKIAASAEQQADGLQQVNVAVGEMDGVTQQNAAMVEQATAASRSLAEEANALVRQVSCFKVKNVEQTSAILPSPKRSILATIERPASRPSRSPALKIASGGISMMDEWAEF